MYKKGVSMRKIVLISGSNRPDNFTYKALSVVNHRLTKTEVQTRVIDARQLTLSFPGQPLTKDAIQLKKSVLDASGIILATPEYHGSFSAIIKLILENLGFPSALSGKPVALLGVAAGRIGAIKSLEHLSSICTHIGAIMVPGSISIAGVQKAFDSKGNCTDPATEKSLISLAEGLLGFLKNYICPKYVLEEMIRNDAEPWSTSV
jgi:NAD(P)H-dependent FMN reductase